MIGDNEPKNWWCESISREHFELLYSSYFPRVYRFALKRLRDPGEAEDVSQEVFVTVFRALDTWAGNSSLLVYTIE